MLLLSRAHIQPNIFTHLQFDTQQDTMYHTKQKALLIQGAINHSGPAHSLLSHFLDIKVLF